MSEQSERKRVILSGIQPTGTFTLGNYIDALSQSAKLQDQFDCLYMVADLHALTVRQEPAALRRTPARPRPCCWPPASPGPEHPLCPEPCPGPHPAELDPVLQRQFGELSRMTQFKDKSAKHPDNVNGGLFHLSGPDGRRIS